MATYVENRTSTQLREHYLIEKELAQRLRVASKQVRRTLYNDVYDERLQRIPHHPLIMQANEPNAQMRAVIPQLRLLKPFLTPTTIFLEIGPGDGALSLAVVAHVQKVYAVDVSSGLAEESVRPPNFEWVVSDGINIPIPNNSADIAYSNQLMEHLHPEDAYEQVCNVYRALAPGGKYICITPNRLSGPWDISRHFDRIATGLHLKEYTITELVNLFEQAGFSKVQIFLSYHGYHLSPMLPLLPFSLIEYGLGTLPFTLRRKLANLLTSVKVVATKS